MINRFWFLLFVLLFAFSIYFSSVGFSQKFNGGIIVGFSASQVDGDNQHGYNKLGLKIGGYVVNKFSDKVFLRIETYYIGKGAKKSANTEIGDFSYFQSHFDYIEMPFLLNYNLNNKFIFEVGLAGAFLFSSSIEDEFGKIDPNTYNLKNYDFSFTTGLGYMINRYFLIKLNFSYSFNSITEHSSQPKWYNNVMSISVSYQF